MAIAVQHHRKILPAIIVPYAEPGGVPAIGLPDPIALNDFCGGPAADFADSNRSGAVAARGIVRRTGQVPDPPAVDLPLGQVTVPILPIAVRRAAHRIAA